MFELIRANKRRSAVLVFVMLMLLLAFGFAIGGALFPGAPEYARPGTPHPYHFNPAGGIAGMGIAFFIWMFQAALAYFQGGNILLAVSGAKRIEKKDHPQLYNVVEEMSIAAGLPKPPAVYVMDDMSLNAFATGRSPEDAAVAVTAGLLGRMNRDQLQGVVAHEIGHIVNRDILFMTMIGIMLGTIVMLADLFLRSLWYSGGSSRRYRSDSDKNGGGAQAILYVVAIVLAILAPLLAQVIYFACSRRREYLADASAAVFTRYPEGLASALEAISGDSGAPARVSKATAPMYISNPLQKDGAALHLFATHPPIAQRIAILRGMAGGVSYANYQAAWASAAGRDAAAMPRSALGAQAQPAREADPNAAAEPGKRRRMRDAGDLARMINRFVFIPCACGLRVKVPPDFARDTIACPRCNATLTVPREAAAATPPPLPAPSPSKEEPPLEVAVRRDAGWQSVQCACGGIVNIAPSCEAAELRCPKCRRKIVARYE